MSTMYNSDGMSPQTMAELQGDVHVQDESTPDAQAGRITFKYFTPKKSTFSFRFEDLELYVEDPARDRGICAAIAPSCAGGQKKFDKKLIAGITGEIKAFEMVAVMGASGAGKTTFMSTLCGRATYGALGERSVVSVNGERLPKGTTLLHKYRNQVGFVPQDDVVHEDLTVEENLTYSAELRLPANRGSEDVRCIVEDTLALLELGGRVGEREVKDFIVGSVEKRGISGGQRKRVNIGMEIVSDPTVLFLDEPTSGLDSTTSETVMEGLSDLSNLGITVVAVIHQPRFSIFDMFDRVLLLGKSEHGDGRTVYNGPSYLATLYFEKLGFQLPNRENPADFLMDVISGEVERKVGGEGLWKDDRDTATELYKDWNRDGARHFRDLERKYPTRKVYEQHHSSDEQAPQFSPKEKYIGIMIFSRLDPQERGLEANGLDVMIEVLNNIHSDREFQQLAGKRGVLHNSGREGPIQAAKDWIVRQVKKRLQQSGAQQRMYAFGMSPQTSMGNGHRTEERFSFRSDRRRLLIDWLERMKGGDNVLKVDRDQFKDYLFSTSSRLERMCERLKRLKREGGEGSSAASRTDASFSMQWKVLTRRSFKKLKRDAANLMFDFVLLMLAGILTAVINGPTVSSDVSQDRTNGADSVHHMPSKLTLMVLFFGALSIIAPLRTFGGSDNNRLVFWRESAAGVSTLALFFAKASVDMLLVVLKPVWFFLFYYYLTDSDNAIPMADFLNVLFLISWAASAYGYLVSLLVHPSTANLAAVMVAIVMGAFLAGVTPTLASMSGVMLLVTDFSYGRWGTEALVVDACTGLLKKRCDELDPRSGGVLGQFGYSSSDNAVLALILLGAFARGLACVLLGWVVNMDKQFKPEVRLPWHKDPVVRSAPSYAAELTTFPSYKPPAQVPQAQGPQTSMGNGHSDVRAGSYGGGSPQATRHSDVRVRAGSYGGGGPRHSNGSSGGLGPRRSNGAYGGGGPRRSNGASPQAQQGGGRATTSAIDARTSGGTKTLKTSRVEKYPMGTQVSNIGDGTMNGWWVAGFKADSGGNTGPGIIKLRQRRPSFSGRTVY